LGLASGGEMVTTRTNVAPTVPGVAGASVQGFTYSVPGRGRPAPAFRLSGATESRHDGAPGDKLRSIVEQLEARMAELGVRWEDATAVVVYGPDAAAGALPGVLPALGAAGLHGLTWMPSRPPISDAEFEIDAAGVGTEIVL
ncbi:MAG TPA: hypothetical protein VLW53_18490, partial [Candidatus Eisenbacteria bacterium]|nr:hypothetical protein [Candidatus Eisenbacteria bacterium]